MWAGKIQDEDFSILNCHRSSVSENYCTLIGEGLR